MFLQAMFVALALLLACAPAEAHSIARNRYFPGTLTFDARVTSENLSTSAANMHMIVYHLITADGDGAL